MKELLELDKKAKGVTIFSGMDKLAARLANLDTGTSTRAEELKKLIHNEVFSQASLMEEWLMVTSSKLKATISTGLDKLKAALRGPLTKWKNEKLAKAKMQALAQMKAMQGRVDDLKAAIAAKNGKDPAMIEGEMRLRSNLDADETVTVDPKQHHQEMMSLVKEVRELIDSMSSRLDAAENKKRQEALEKKQAAAQNDAEDDDEIAGTSGSSSSGSVGASDAPKAASQAPNDASAANKKTSKKNHNNNSQKKKKASASASGIPKNPAAPASKPSSSSKVSSGSSSSGGGGIVEQQWGSETSASASGSAASAARFRVALSSTSSASGSASASSTSAASSSGAEASGSEAAESASASPSVHVDLSLVTSFDGEAELRKELAKLEDVERQANAEQIATFREELKQLTPKYEEISKLEQQALKERMSFLESSSGSGSSSASASS
eukprot:TRINITY_DN113503_c0_g1_i1.p1 TRINITY_DN113503_c0_g1~~TRINITY_DN113503_c0_g1_i1.p1  ORF type:complete len:492 (-),score=258.64 TRINITY_DN113503_c0_g1_i1:86-1405(-)